MLGALPEKRAESVRSVALSWSGGKDSMHGARRSLLEAQAISLGLLLRPNFISKGADNAEYECIMAEDFAACRAQGIYIVAFGDLFLEDTLRAQIAAGRSCE